ncbi:MAG: SPFH domain-containing protein [Lachnospiraceae bacterium]|nr:SPFH domain-containing protein [Lachnospiraceae bacterium]
MVAGCTLIALLEIAVLFILRDKSSMIEGYKSIKEIADEWGLTTRSVRAMCANNKIKGAEKIGRDWIIPSEAERPMDKRITTGEYRNWRKTMKGEINMPAITSVIKYEGDNKTFVWKYPNTDFNTGSELIVHESQEAIFMANGEILDVFGAGKHILETANLPIIRGIQKLATGGKAPFHAELYFINKAEQMAIKWGTDSKISYLDPVYDFPLEIGACGEMSLNVTNSTKFLVKLVGTEKVLNQDTLTKYFRAFLMTRVKSIISQKIKENNLSIFEIDMHLAELSEAVKIPLVDDFEDYGINLSTFFITTVVKPDEDRNFIKFKELYYRKHNDVTEAEIKQRVTLIEQSTKAQTTVMEAEALAKKREIEGYTYQQEKSFEVAKEMAKNDAVGQLANVGIGMGMIGGIGGTLGQTVAGMAQNVMSEAIGKGAGANVQEDDTVSVSNIRFCTNCGKELMEGMMFCGYCGTKRPE